jgi:hypothetical protein
MARRPAPVTTNGHRTHHVPGVYEQVLRKLCDQRVSDAIRPDWLVASDSPEQLAKWEAEYAERMAAELQERAGKPVRVQGWMLPRGLPPPFNGAGRRLFVVGPDDVISLHQTSTKSA